MSLGDGLYLSTKGGIGRLTGYNRANHRVGQGEVSDFSLRVDWHGCVLFGTGQAISLYERLRKQSSHLVEPPSLTVISVWVGCCQRRGLTIEILLMNGYGLV